MSIVVTGSIAYDHIMVFPDHFQQHILSGKTHLINLCFNVTSLDLQFGGTAANIVYNLALLGDKCDLFATAGHDFDAYALRLDDLGISREYVHVFSDVNTAQAFITTDLSDNQITAFYGGAMYRAHEHPLSSYVGEPSYVIVSPNGIQAMKDHSEYCRRNSWPFLFDPGQSLPAFDAQQLINCLRASRALLVNDYEWEMFTRKTGLQIDDVLQLTSFVLVTLGSQGARLYSREGVYESAAVPDLDVVDPTGAGDAFRAGLLSGLLAHYSYTDLLKYSCSVASFSLGSFGPQSHLFSREDVIERMSLI